MTEPDTKLVLALAAIIREVDGNNSLGAAALAEAILKHPSTRDLEKLSSQSKEFQSETIRKALALYLEAMSDVDNKVLIVNDTKKTQKEIILF